MGAVISWVMRFLPWVLSGLISIGTWLFTTGKNLVKNGKFKKNSKAIAVARWAIPLAALVGAWIWWSKFRSKNAPLSEGGQNKAARLAAERIAHELGTHKNQNWFQSLSENDQRAYEVIKANIYHIAAVDSYYIDISEGGNSLATDINLLDNWMIDELQPMILENL